MHIVCISQLKSCLWHVSRNSPKYNGNLDFREIEQHWLMRTVFVSIKVGKQCFAFVLEFV